MSWETFRLLAWSWIGVAVLVFILLHFITAPYGRHSKTTWGPMVSNKWGWVVMEVFVLCVLYYFVFTGSLKQSSVNWFVLSLFTLHYVNRSLVFPFRLKTKGKKMPLVIVLMGMTFNMANGFLIGYYLGNFKAYESDWLVNPLFWIGLIIFIFGMAVNWQSDNILLHLRKPGEKGYKIPQGGFFKWLSCPNLFGECVEWLGFALLTWSLPGLAFFVWTIANLIPRALSHHRWYQAKFPDYPKNRKAIFPFLW